MELSDHVQLGELAKAARGDRVVRLARADRRQHCYAVGKTGLGKTTFLRNLIL